MNNGNGSAPDPNAGLYVIQITFDPVSGQIKVQSTAPTGVIFLGMMESGKAAMMKSAEQKGPQIAVPKLAIVP